MKSPRVHRKRTRKEFRLSDYGSPAACGVDPYEAGDLIMTNDPKKVTCRRRECRAQSK